MSHQCSCGRDLNNNYVSYTSAYANANSSLDREANNASLSGGGSGKSSTKSSLSMGTRSMSAAAAGVGIGGPQTQLTAKVMFGTVGAIKELREKEKSRHNTARAGDRRN